jgi:hypothetical protein
MRNEILFLLVPLAICSAQVSSVVSLSNGIQLRIYAQSAEGTPVALKTEIQPASGNSFYRIYKDENGLAVFAYELAVERTADGEQFRVTAQSAGSEFATQFPNADGGKPTPTISEPRESPLLSSGDQFTIEIPTDPGLQQTITDTVQVRLNQRGAPPSEPGAQSPAQLRFVALSVNINGKLVSPSGVGAVVLGRYAMFYLPGRGGYFFSTDAVDRRTFVRVGVVDGTRLRFTVDNESYECESESSILMKSERGEIWVYHDAGYKPAGNWTKSDPSDETRDQFFTAASDSLNWWLP